MRDLRLLARQVGFEQKSYWRNPAAAFFTFAFPLVFFFIFESVFGKGNIGPRDHPIRAIDYYTPSILAYGVMSACFLSVALQFVVKRETGIFKRLRGTPLPAWILVGGAIGSSLVVTFLLTVISLGFATTVYGVTVQAGHLPAVIATILLAALAFCALGIAASSFIPNADAGPAAVNLPYFVLVFISGTYFPVHGGLAKAASYLPLQPFIQALQNGVIGTTGSGWSGRDVGRILIWGAVGAFIAARRFRWSPYKR